jgi:hypothetical protein
VLFGQLSRVAHNGRDLVATRQGFVQEFGTDKAGGAEKGNFHMVELESE